MYKLNIILSSDQLDHTVKLPIKISDTLQNSEVSFKLRCTVESGHSFIYNLF